MDTINLQVKLPYFRKEGYLYLVLGVYEREGFRGQRMTLDCVTAGNTSDDPGVRRDIGMSRARLNTLPFATFRLTGEVK